MNEDLEYAYGYMASVNMEPVEMPVVPMGRSAVVWHDTPEAAQASMDNDLRYRTETFLIARPKVQWFRWEPQG